MFRFELWFFGLEFFLSNLLNWGVEDVRGMVGLFCIMELGVVELVIFSWFVCVNKLSVEVDFVEVEC